MPWLETDPVTERKKFIIEAQGGLFSHAELCRRHGISRQKGYKWLERYGAEGPDGLLDRSHRPHSCPHATEPHVLEAALELRKARPRWGAAKILATSPKSTRSGRFRRARSFISTSCARGSS
jgi:transposase-like protein